MKFMARFTSALLKLRASNLREIAVALKAGVKEDSNYRRIRRFLSDYEVGFATLGRLLIRLLPQKPLYKVILDRTEWYFGEKPVNVLMVGIAHKGIAFPISWTVLPEGGSSSAKAQQEALRSFFDIVDPEDVEVVIGDREFISTNWLCWLQDQEVSFVVRLRSDRRIGFSPEGPSLPARMFARPLATGEEKVLDGTCHLSGSEGKQVELRVVMRRIASDSGDSEDQFLILATCGVDPEDATVLYAQRWEILALFAALKSRGYRLEETHLTAPDRVQRLIGLLALAFPWTHIVGERRANREGPPRKKSHGRRPAESISVWAGPASGNFDHARASAPCLLRLLERTSKSHCVFVLYIGSHVATGCGNLGALRRPEQVTLNMKEIHETVASTLSPYYKRLYIPTLKQNTRNMKKLQFYGVIPPKISIHCNKPYKNTKNKKNLFL